MSLTLKQVFYWGIAAIALIALAAPFPTIATGFCVLLIAGVILNNWSEYQDYLVLPK